VRLLRHTLSHYHPTIHVPALRPIYTELNPYDVCACNDQFAFSSGRTASNTSFNRTLNMKGHAGHVPSLLGCVYVCVYVFRCPQLSRDHLETRVADPNFARKTVATATSPDHIYTTSLSYIIVTITPRPHFTLFPDCRRSDSRLILLDAGLHPDEQFNVGSCIAMALHLTGNSTAQFASSRDHIDIPHHRPLPRPATSK
jgi:hypothetical protein